MTRFRRGHRGQAGERAPGRHRRRRRARLRGRRGGRWGGPGRAPAPLKDVQADHNLYWITEARKSARLTLKRYKAMGVDANSLSVDPLFVDPANGDFSLTASAANLIDQGNATYAPVNDYIGTNRPQGAADDIGAYEYVSKSSSLNNPPSPPTDLKIISR